MENIRKVVVYTYRAHNLKTDKTCKPRICWSNSNSSILSPDDMNPHQRESLAHTSCDQGMVLIALLSKLIIK